MANEELLEEEIEILSLTDENGNETETPLNWSFGGAAAGCYVAEVASDSLTVTVQCIFPSDLPLIITASRDNISASVEIILEGY